MHTNAINLYQTTRRNSDNKLFTVVTAIFLLIGYSNILCDESNLNLSYENGLDAYNKKQFEAAKQIFDNLLKTDPRCAQCYHMKGKSYGRIAEQASWLKAIKYARETLKALKAAHRLAPENTVIIEDLIEFYTRAPLFLGGNNKKAKQLKHKLITLQGAEKLQ